MNNRLRFISKLLKTIKTEARKTRPYQRTFALNSNNRPTPSVIFFPTDATFNPRTCNQTTSAVQKRAIPTITMYTRTCNIANI
jgi:hypothetical protein